MRESYINGLDRAFDRGFAAGRENVQVQNPYKRFEHYKCWKDGYAAGKLQSEAIEADAKEH